MRKPGISTLLLVASCATAAIAQGGKAEPKRIIFIPESGRGSVVGSLLSAQEAEFVFTARKGQKVTVRNPGNKAFDFRIFDPKTGFDTEFDSSSILEFTIESDGEYLLFVRRKVARGPRIAKFAITLTVKRPGSVPPEITKLYTNHSISKP